jgi:hypothetical protein
MGNLENRHYDGPKALDLITRMSALVGIEDTIWA